MVEGAEMSKLCIFEEYENTFTKGFRYVESLEEHDKQIRAEAIDEFQEWLKTQIVGIDNKTKEILVVREDRWELAIDEYKKQLKE